MEKSQFELNAEKMIETTRDFYTKKEAARLEKTRQNFYGKFVLGAEAMVPIYIANQLAKQIIENSL